LLYLCCIFTAKSERIVVSACDVVGDYLAEKSRRVSWDVFDAGVGEST